MLDVLGIDTTQLFWIAIVYGVIVTLYNLLMISKVLRKCLGTLKWGFVELITASLLMQAWNTYFRDTEYISTGMFWVVFLWLTVIMILGLFTIVRKVMSCDANY